MNFCVRQRTVSHKMCKYITRKGNSTTFGRYMVLDGFQKGRNSTIACTWNLDASDAKLPCANQYLHNKDVLGILYVLAPMAQKGIHDFMIDDISLNS